MFFLFLTAQFVYFIDSRKRGILSNQLFSFR